MLGALLVTLPFCLIGARRSKFWRYASVGLVGGTALNFWWYFG